MSERLSLPNTKSATIIWKMRFVDCFSLEYTNGRMLIRSEVGKCRKAGESEKSPLTRSSLDIPSDIS